MWEGWVARTGRDRYRLISVDLPGHGLTGAWPRDEYTIEAYADFIEVLVDSAAARSLRARRPFDGRRGGLELRRDAARPGQPSHPGRPRAYPSAAGERRSMRLSRAPLIGDIGIYFKPERCVGRSLREIYSDPAMITPDRSAPVGELQRFPGNRQATLLRARTQGPLDPTPLRRLDVPTLIIWGAKDRWVPVADAFRLQGDIKGATLAIFEKLGHNPMEEDPGHRRCGRRLPADDPQRARVG